MYPQSSSHKPELLGDSDALHAYKSLTTKYNSREDVICAAALSLLLMGLPVVMGQGQTGPAFPK